MRPKTLLATGAATAVTAAIGSVASTETKSSWYVGLDKPAFQPPPIAFPIVWTALYLDIAITSAAAMDVLAERRATGERDAFRRALAANLALNASWPWMFFRFHRLPEATATAGLLAVSSADLARRAGAASRPAGRALISYVAWCAFAAGLSGSIWRRNR